MAYLLTESRSRMSTAELSPTARTKIAAGYKPVGPAREHLRAIIATEKVSFNKLAQHLQWASATLLRIHDGTAQLIHPVLETRLLAVELEQLHLIVPQPETETDEVMLHRLVHNDTVAIVARDKPVYARALHKKHGWTKNQISRRLGMSWSKVNEALVGGAQ
ncbi:hypothetical protein ACWIGI_28530 [Nocardia sp. NPDC055321]